MTARSSRFRPGINYWPSEEPSIYYLQGGHAGAAGREEGRAVARNPSEVGRNRGTKTPIGEDAVVAENDASFGIAKDEARSVGRIEGDRRLGARSGSAEHEAQRSQ